MVKKIFFFLYFLFLLSSVKTNAQYVLLGDNPPNKNLYDGNFELVKSYWRKAKQSPFWKTTVLDGKEKMGLHNGTLFSMNKLAIAESKILDGNPNYKTPKRGDVLYWEFGADLEYISQGMISFAIIFGNKEVLLANKIPLKGSDKVIEHFKGSYTITEDDANQGLPYVKVTFYSGEDVKIYLHYVNIKIENKSIESPILNATAIKDGIKLDWVLKESNKDLNFYIYRTIKNKDSYLKIGETKNTSFEDQNLINGIEYSYVVTKQTQDTPLVSNKTTIACIDKTAPKAPAFVSSEALDTEIKISWKKSIFKDVKNYSVYRGDATGNNFREIAHNLTKPFYVDFTPLKETTNTYIIYAHDYSGNKSNASIQTKAKVKTIIGTSFSDLIQPMPIHKNLTKNTWGADNVIPRDIDNGIESVDWTYWGGTPIFDKDGNYHMNITRWPANATKGHWEWPNSTVAHIISKRPTGPYTVKDEIAYTYANGKGHNPDIIKLNDGSYLLYSLIDWEATLFHSNSMNGPWKRLGIMEVDWKASNENPASSYRFYRNLSGIHLEDGRFLFVTKAGAMMRSRSKNPLGPYDILSKPIQGNPIIPEKYRNSNYEDPVLWKDENQYHMIINAFWDYRAIYLRSENGVHWKFNSGTAYTPDNTSYTNGMRTHWYKLERPHVLQDNYGRATHLSLAVIDVPKADDLANDNHNSKNIILPLTVPKRIELITKKKIDQTSKKIKIKILAEPGFDPLSEIDVKSLRFGASEEVDFGRGCTVIKTKKKGKDLLLEFDGNGNGIKSHNFVGKLIGKTISNKLIIAYCKLD